MSKVLAQRVTQLEAALRTMIELAPQEQPATEEYDDTESAYNNGVDNGAWDLAQHGIAALASPAKATDLELVQLAIVKLREARDLLVSANAPRATERIRHALKSAEGAARNADCRSVRHTRTQQPSA